MSNEDPTGRPIYNNQCIKQSKLISKDNLIKKKYIYPIMLK
jgi:hypothetical protein